METESEYANRLCYVFLATGNQRGNDGPASRETYMYDVPTLGTYMYSLEHLNPISEHKEFKKREGKKRNIHTKDNYHIRLTQTRSERKQADAYHI